MKSLRIVLLSACLAAASGASTSACALAAAISGPDASSGGVKYRLALWRALAAPEGASSRHRTDPYRGARDGAAAASRRAPAGRHLRRLQEGSPDPGGYWIR